MKKYATAAVEIRHTCGKEPQHGVFCSRCHVYLQPLSHNSGNTRQKHHNQRHERRNEHKISYTERGNKLVARLWINDDGCALRAGDRPNDNTCWANAGALFFYPQTRESEMRCSPYQCPYFDTEDGDCCGLCAGEWCCTHLVSHSSAAVCMCTCRLQRHLMTHGRSNRPQCCI